MVANQFIIRILAAVSAVLLSQAPLYSSGFVINPYAFQAAGGGASVAIDTSVKKGGQTSVTSFTLAISVASNSNRALYVFVGCGDGTDRIGHSASSDLDGAFTSIGSVDEGVWTGMQAFRLLNPSTGSHTITITLAGSIDQAEAFAISLYNVNQTTPNGTIGTTSGASGTAPSASATVGSGGLLIGSIASDSEASLSVTTGTSLQTTLNVASDTAYNLASNTGTGSISITWSQVSNRYAAIVVPVNSQ